MNKEQEKNPLTEKIIEEALRLYEIQAFKFTMDEIAKNLTISKKTIYKYFKTKELLIIECIDVVFQDIYEEHRSIIEEDLEPLKKLKKILAVYPSIYDIENLNMEELNNFPGAIKRIEFHLNSNWETTFQILQQCKALKLVKEIDNNYFRIIMVGVFRSCLQEENHHEVLEKCIEYIFQGILI